MSLMRGFKDKRGASFGDENQLRQILFHLYLWHFHPWFIFFVIDKPWTSNAPKNLRLLLSNSAVYRACAMDVALKMQGT